MGLLRGMARTAVVAGTATAVSNRVTRRQAERWSDEEIPQQAEPMDGAGDTDLQIEQLEKLGQLRDKGIITEAEFELKKREILG